MARAPAAAARPRARAALAVAGGGLSAGRPARRAALAASASAGCFRLGGFFGRLLGGDAGFLFLLAFLALFVVLFAPLHFLGDPLLLLDRARRRRRSRSRSPIVPITSWQERIASSLPGITKSTGFGSQLVSTRPMIGIRRRAASRTAISSVLRSVTKTASGSRSMSRTPPRLYSSLASSACMPIRSLVGSRSSLPSSRQSVSSCSREIRCEIVLKLVSRPPSQRWFT